MLLIATFGFLAVVLSALGMYGVISFVIAQRTREIGIRMALGAKRLDVFGMVVGQGARLAGLGIAIGLAGALATTRLMQDELYGVKALGTLTFATAPLLLLTMALPACYVPARRAMSVEPTVALRQE